MTNAKFWLACVLLGLLAGLPGRAAGTARQPAASQAGHAGPVHVGQRFSALAGGAAWRHEADLSLDDCRYYTGGRLPAGVAMMVLSGTVVRFDLDTARAAGPFGLRVGHTAAEARRRMPAGATLERGYRFSETRHLVWHSANLAVRAELAPDERIGHLSWGRRDAVDRAEACL